MGATLIGFVVGLAVGAASGSAMGAFGVAVVGMFVGVAVHAYGWMRSHLGDAPTVERHRAMCTPYGQPADLELVGDLETGRWFDVKSCSLLRPSTEVDCDKGCLRQIRLAGVRPGRPCHCEGTTDSAGART